MLERKLVRFSSPENRIDRAEERAYAIVALWTGTIEPFDTAIASRDETIRTRGDVHNDLALRAQGRAQRHAAMFDDTPPPAVVKLPPA